MNLPQKLYNVETLADDLAAAFNSHAVDVPAPSGPVPRDEAKAAQLLNEVPRDGSRGGGDFTERHHA